MTLSVWSVLLSNSNRGFVVSSAGAAEWLWCVVAETVSARVSCDGVADTNGNCYQLQTSRKSWSDANATCSHVGLQLAAVQVTH